MLVGIAIEIPFAIGEAVLGVEAYLIRFLCLTISLKTNNDCLRDWRTLQMVAYLPLLCLIGLWWELNLRKNRS